MTPTFSPTYWRRACDRSQRRADIQRAEPKPFNWLALTALLALLIALTLLGSWIAGGWLPSF